MRKILAAGAMLAGMLCGTAQAETIKMDFNDLPYGTHYFNNFEYRGFRFSPNCVASTMRDDWGVHTSTSMGPFLTGCDHRTDPFLGPDLYKDESYGNGVLYIDKPGYKFSLISWVQEPWVGIIASNGAYWLEDDINVYGHIDFVGDQWRNLDWIIVIGGSGEPRTFDDLVLEIPEPSSLALAGLGLLGLLGVRRRK